MKNLKFILLSIFILFIFVPVAHSSILMSVNFDETTALGDPLYPVDSVYGNVTGLKNLFGTTVPVDGGTIVDVNGNKMVKIQGQNPYIATEFGIHVDTHNVMLDEISFNFFFDSVESTQNSLTIPSVLTVELFLIGSDDELIDTKYLLYFTKDGVETGGMDIAPDPSSYPSPYNDNFSLSNLAAYTAHLGSLASYIFDNSKSIYLVPTMIYPDRDDPYDTIAYFDDFVARGQIIPEPAVCLFFVLGLFILPRKLRRK